MPAAPIPKRTRSPIRPTAAYQDCSTRTPKLHVCFVMPSFPQRHALAVTHMGGRAKSLIEKFLERFLENLLEAIQYFRRLLRDQRGVFSASSNFSAVAVRRSICASSVSNSSLLNCSSNCRLRSCAPSTIASCAASPAAVSETSTSRLSFGFADFAISLRETSSASARLICPLSCPTASASRATLIGGRRPSEATRPNSTEDNPASRL